MVQAEQDFDVYFLKTVHLCYVRLRKYRFMMYCSVTHSLGDVPLSSCTGNNGTVLASDSYRFIHMRAVIASNKKVIALETSKPLSFIALRRGQ